MSLTLQNNSDMLISFRNDLPCELSIRVITPIDLQTPGDRSLLLRLSVNCVNIEAGNSKLDANFFHLLNAKVQKEFMRNGK